MASIDVLPAEILADIFAHEGLADITRQVCRRWRGIALPLWLRRLLLLPSDPFKDLGMLKYLQDLPEHDRLFVRALDIASRHDVDVNSSVFYTEVADQACVRNVLQIQSLLGPRIVELTITDTGWAPESLADILSMNLVTTRHLHSFQISVCKVESFDLLDLVDCLIRLYRRDCGHLKSLSLDLNHPIAREQWLAIADCTELQHFHLGLHRSSEPILSEICELIFPKWGALSELYICQPRSLSAETLRCLYMYLPRPDRLRELHLIFGACQASLYEQEFIAMVHAMPNLQILEAHLDWTNRMMEHVAMTLPDLRELSVTCSSLDFNCDGIQYMVWGQALEKVNMRTSGKIWGGFLDAPLRSRAKAACYRADRTEDLFSSQFQNFQPGKLLAMALRSAASGVKLFLEQELKNPQRSSLEYAAFATLSLVLAAMIKYPDRAIFTKARPDLKDKTCKGYPLVGNMPEALMNKGNSLLLFYYGFQQFGDVYTLTFPGRGLFIMVNSPAHIEHVLKTNFNNYIKGNIFSDQVRDILGKGIFVSDGESWRFHRKIAANIFTTKMYRQLCEGAFTISARTLCSVLDNNEALGKAVDLQQLFLALTMDVFGQLTFGFKFDALVTDGPHEFGDAFDYLTANVDSRIANPFWPIAEKLTPGKTKQIKRAMGIIDRYAHMAIAKRRSETEQEREKRAKDLLDHFINHVAEDGSKLTDEDLRDVFVNFMIAGRDTTGLTLTWQFYSLIANPRILKNVLKELRIVLQGSELYTYETLTHGLPYLKAVFHETLRLYPQVPRNVKEAVDDDVLPDGTVVHKGDTIGFSTWCMGRNKAVWGIDAEQFVPERWLVDDDDEDGKVPQEGVSPFGKFRVESQHKFNSFNSGPRLCLGQTFATLEAMITSCMLLQNFDFKLVPGQPEPEPKPSATLPMLHPLMVHATRKHVYSAFWKLPTRVLISSLIAIDITQSPCRTFQLHTMANTMTLVGLSRLIDRQLRKNRKRSPFEYLVLATMGVLVAAIIKYPNRAFLTKARPDLKDKSVVGFPLIGSLPSVLKNREDQLRTMNDGFQRFGGSYTLTLPLFGRIIFINSPEQYEYVLKTNFNNYIKGKVFSDQLQDVLGKGIFVSDGEAWRFHRKTASNIFTTKLYRQLVEGAFMDTGLNLCTALERNRIAQRSSDLQELFLKLTLDAFGKLTFGLDFRALLTDGTHEFGDAFDYLTANIDGRVSNPFWFITDKVIPGKTRKLRSAIGVLDKYAYMAVEKRRAETNEEKENRPKDLLDHFINHVADDGSKLTDLELRDVFVNFMIAGRDTTAQTLTWQFYSLMANPRVMNNLIREIDIVLQGTQPYTYEIMMQELPYLKAVFHETLRLYPPVPKNIKTVVEDDSLPGGIRVYKGDVIGISTWCLGRNTDVWGPDAELFVPERWLVESTSDASYVENRKSNTSPFGKFRAESPYKFTSFNAGPRLCLGQTFATLEGLVTTCLLLQRYQFRLEPGQKQPPAVKGSVTLPMLHPLKVIVDKRAHNSEMTANYIILVSLRRFIDKLLHKNRRRVLIAAIIKYPNRAFRTRARPDLKDKSVIGFPLIGSLPVFLWFKEDQLGALRSGFKRFANFNNYVKGKIHEDQLRDVLGEGIFVSDQEAWRFHRKTATNIFTTKIYRQLVDGAFMESTLDLCTVLERHLEAQGSVDLQALFLKLTLDTFGKLIFGVDFRALLTDGPHEFGDAFDYLLVNFDDRVLNQFWPITDHIVPGKAKKVQDAIAVLDKYAYMAVEKRRAESEEERENRPKDLLDHFINHVADDGSKLTDLELRDVFVNFMIAGRDSTSQALTWQFYSLMANPRVMSNVVREIDVVLQGSHSYTYETMMQGLPYLKAVFHETLRLYPPVPKHIKMAVEDDCLPGGVRVYKGEVIGMSVWCMARNTDVWGPDAELFVPERWLIESTASDTSSVEHKKSNTSPFGKFRSESPYKFPSFNAGPRLCIGQTFATLQAMVTTCLLLQKYKFTLQPGQKPAVAKRSVTMPMLHPLKVVVEQRVAFVPGVIWYRESQLEILLSGFKRFGSLFTMTMPVFGRIIFVNSPEHYEHVLKTNFNNYIKGKMLTDPIKDVLGNGIFVSNHEAWRSHRKIAASMFTTKLNRQLVEGAFMESALDFCTVLDRSRIAQRPVDLQELFSKLTLDAFGKLTFGVDFKALLTDGPHEFGDAFNYLLDTIERRGANPLWGITEKIMPGQRNRIESALRTLDKYAYMAVEERKAESADKRESRSKDLLDHFINHVADDGSKLTDLELRDVFINFMIAGRDSTSQTLTWQFYSLMTHPQVMNNLMHEIDTVLQGSQSYTYEILMQELPYLKAVFHETLRLYPSVPKNAKMVVEDDFLPCGTRVYKGDVIGMSTWCLGRNTDVWGPDAELFVPERWLVESISSASSAEHKKSIVSPFGKFRAESPYKFPAFNAGPRLCLGQTFATLQALVTTCHLLQKYKFTLEAGQKPAIAKVSVTLPMLNPLQVIVDKRTV
ncbi:hypothetical protein BGX28_007676 [Mortierella sp. GBA30]|nr:hypothetical protein BGX28_007676 [Mortierella sp. GBA30]